MANSTDQAVRPVTVTRPAEAATRAVARSVTAQLAAKAVHLLLNVVSSLAIVRALAPGAYGHYVLIVTAVTLAGLVPDFGLGKAAVREMAVRPRDEPEVLGTVLGIRLGLSVLGAAIVQAILVVVDAPSEVHVAGAVMSLLFLAEAVVGVAIVCHARTEQQYEAGILVAAETVETGLVLAMVASGASLVWLVTAPVIGLGVGALLAVVLVRRHYRLRMRWSPGRVRPLLREAAPVGLAGVIGVIVFRLDSVMLAGLADPEQVGLYGAAFQPMEYALLGVIVLSSVLLPHLSRAFVDDPGRFRELHRLGLRGVVVAVLPVVVVLSPFADRLVGTVFGPAYLGAAAPLRLLAIALVCMAVSAWQAYALLAAGEQRLTLLTNLGALVVAASANLALIPSHGALGAAIATVITAAVTAVTASVLAARHGGAPLPDGGIGRAIIAAVVSTPVGFVLADALPWPIAAIAAVAAYGVAVTAVGAIDLAALRAVLGSESPSATEGAPR